MADIFGTTGKPSMSTVCLEEIHIDVNFSTADSGPLIGLKMRTHAQCALASRKQVESIGSPQRNTAKYSDYVAITIINILQNISLTISATWEGA